MTRSEILKVIRRKTEYVKVNKGEVWGSVKDVASIVHSESGVDIRECQGWCVWVTGTWVRRWFERLLLEVTTMVTNAKKKNLKKKITELDSDPEQVCWFSTTSAGFYCLVICQLALLGNITISFSCQSHVSHDCSWTSSAECVWETQQLTERLLLSSAVYKRSVAYVRSDGKINQDWRRTHLISHV